MGQHIVDNIHDLTGPGPMRALMVSTVPITLTSFLIPLAELLKSQGYAVDCAAQQAREAEGLDIFDERYDISWSRSFARSALNYLSSSRQIKKIVAMNDYSIIHVHTPIAALITRLALRRKGRFGGAAPVIIYTAHGFHFHKQEKSRLKNGLFFSAERLALCWTDYLVTMNDEDSEAVSKLTAKGRCPLRNICLSRRMAGAAHCARNRAQFVRIDGIGFDFSSRAHLREVNRTRLKEYAQVSDSKGAASLQLVMIAELNRNKSHLELLDELSKLRASGANFKMTFIGEGPLRNEIEKKIEHLKLEDNVELTGQLRQDEIEDILNKAHIGLLVSKREGLPRSLMEIIAAGIPVIGTNIRGISDEVRNPHALISELGTGKLVDIIARFAKEPDGLSRLADEQYSYALTHFDLALVLEKYSELYRRAQAQADATYRRAERSS